MATHQPGPAKDVGDKEQESTETLTFRSQRSDGQDERSYLIVFQDGTSSIFRLPPEGVVTIGRSSQATLRLSDDMASRLHAEIRVLGSVITVADLGSHNGTLVNGEPILSRREVRSGDTIAICN